MITLLFQAEQSPNLVEVYLSTSCVWSQSFQVKDAGLGPSMLGHAASGGLRQRLVPRVLVHGRRPCPWGKARRGRKGCPCPPETAERVNATANQKWPGQGGSKCPKVSRERFRSAKRGLAWTRHSVSPHSSWYLQFKGPLCHSPCSTCPYHHAPSISATSHRAPKRQRNQMSMEIS